MRIILDINLGKLAKWLRILGYDAEIAENILLLNRDPEEGDLYIVKCRKSRDALIEKGRNSVFIPFDSIETQIMYLVSEGIIERTQTELQRCPVCNKMTEPVEKGTIKDKVAPFVYKNNTEFRICNGCGRVYWNATHTAAMREKIGRYFKDRPLSNLGVTAGDMNGCGPQILLKLYTERKDIFREKRIFIIGSIEVLEYYKRLYAKHSRKLEKCVFKAVKDTAAYDPSVINVIDVKLRKSEKFSPGSPSASAGSHTMRILEQSVSRFYSREIDIIINLPNSKESLNMAGHDLSGATEFYSKAGGDPVMTFFSEDMVLALLTRHLPVSGVPSAVKGELILRTLEVLKPYGTIGVLGLNPHASESGLLGDEEAKIIEPALAEARSRGINVRGPLIPDAFFKTPCDVYLSMYHDQALPLFKYLYLDRSCQATLGIPVRRVSVSHGTAWDRVADYSAETSSLKFILEKGLKKIRW